MIWVDGEILPDDGLAINAADRTFEHGLGLFETLRAVDGRAPLLQLHKARMLRSAGDLRNPVDPSKFPDDEAVRRLCLASGTAAEHHLRITATGGTHSSGPVLWMRARPISADIKSRASAPLRVSLDSWSIGVDDPLARHKSLNFWARRIAYHSAAERGFAETLGLIRKGVYCEGGWSNLFVVSGDRLLTPSLKAPIVPGIMRGLVLGIAEEISMATREVRGIPERQLLEAGEVFLTNALWGIMPVARVDGSDPDRSRDWPAPGPRTLRLQALLADRLDRGEIAP